VNFEISPFQNFGPI